MEVEIITRKDLLEFKRDLLQEIRALIQTNQPAKKWLRTRDVMEMLNISWSTLQRMRIRKAIPYKKLNNTYLYPKDQIEELLNSDQDEFLSAI
ncbi:MAG: helix-turn-helix domain-containing protein [Marinifilaceae bacterium]